MKRLAVALACLLVFAPIAVRAAVPDQQALNYLTTAMEGVDLNDTLELRGDGSRICKIYMHNGGYCALASDLSLEGVSMQQLSTMNLGPYFQVALQCAGGKACWTPTGEGSSSLPSYTVNQIKCRTEFHCDNAMRALLRSLGAPEAGAKDPYAN
jgi:hypothetical protein